jgi:small subunit ribosomal protein S17
MSESSAETRTRNLRKDLVGIVSSRSGDKTVKVTVAYKASHPRYGKEVNRKTVLHVHDDKNETGVGDRVEVMETRPLSKLKRWRIVKVIEAAPKVEAANV